MAKTFVEILLVNLYVLTVNMILVFCTKKGAWFYKDILGFNFRF